MNHIFGPVPSRRLGRSLGIDVIPAKTCSYNCIYCESGPTTCLSNKRKPFVHPDEVLSQLNDFMVEHTGEVDALTFSSAGEPTLYEGLGELIEEIKLQHRELPVVVLTNGSTLSDPQVRLALRKADRVVPTLCAVSESVWRRIHRPHPDLELGEIIDGLEAFAGEYSGSLVLEVLLVAGENDNPSELLKISEVANRLSADSIELNTVVRPPAHRGTRGLSDSEMESARKYFGSERVRTVGCFIERTDSVDQKGLGSRIIELVARRPCTSMEMAGSLGISPGLLEAEISRLIASKILDVITFGGREYLCPHKGDTVI